MTLLGHVLVIDDERILADSIAAYLEHHGVQRRRRVWVVELRVGGGSARRQSQRRVEK